MMRPPVHRSPSPQRAFSLIELLVVIAIFGIMAALAVPAISGIRGAGDITRAGQILNDQIILARQEASSKNRDVEVRIIEIDGDDPGYRAMQLWLCGDTATNPIGRIEKFPDRTLISSNAQLSPLLGGLSNSANFGGLGSRPYRGFRVRAGGSLPNSVTTNDNFLTVCSANDSGVPPDNFFTVRMNPVTGRVSTHRP